MDISLILPAFIAGIITFLAPCTLPLVPGYLGFIGGVSAQDLKDTKTGRGARRKILLNATMYVLGFSLIFIVLGTVFGAAGVALAKYRLWLTRIGGVFVIFFGLYLMHIFKSPIFNFLNREKKLSFGSSLTPGKPSSSFIFGMTFAAGWTPCVGPILGTILFMASTQGQIGAGAFLLSVFSLGLAIPFLLIALAFGHAAQYIKAITKYLHIISFVGGIFLLFLGILLVTDKMSVWLTYSYKLFNFFNYEFILNYL
jgi:cytochrome c-type biogenesis protein